MPVTQEPVRWGVLGCARIATTTVIPAMRGCERSRVVAIASRDVGRARDAAASLGIPRSYGSYDDLLADADVDAVYIPLPNHLHVPWTVRAAEAGKHVLCEKPMALTADEARTLIAVRDRTGVTIGEAFMVRAHPRWLAIRSLLGRGRIGDVRLIHGHFSYSRREATDIRRRAEWGGGALLDIGCYPVTLSRWLLGEEPDAVIATIERDPESHVDRLDSALLRFPSAQATFSCAGELVPYQRWEIFGTQGRMDVALPFNAPPDAPTRILVDDGRDPRGGNIETIEIPAANQYTLQADRFSDAIRWVGDVPVPLEDAIANMAVLDALARSAASGRWESP